MSTDPFSKRPAYTVEHAIPGTLAEFEARIRADERRLAADRLRRCAADGLLSRDENVQRCIAAVLVTLAEEFDPKADPEPGARSEFYDCRYGDRSMKRFTVYRRGDLSKTHNADQANAPDEPQFEGVIFTDGSVVLRWMTSARSTAVWSDFDAMWRIHGHDGYGGTTDHGTSIVFHDGTHPRFRGRNDAAQDWCENCPFGSVGGKDARATGLTAPDYIAEEDRADYLRGYEEASERAWGPDWRTCKFGWAPAMVIGPELLAETGRTP